MTRHHLASPSESYLSFSSPFMFSSFLIPCLAMDDNGATLSLEFNFNGDKSAIPGYLPKTLEGFNDLGHTTSIKLCCNCRCVYGLMDQAGDSILLIRRAVWATSLPIIDCWILCSLNDVDVSVTERFMITAYDTPSPAKCEKSPPYQMVLMNNNYTLMLIDCVDILTISALNPSRVVMRIIVC